MSLSPHRTRPRVALRACRRCSCRRCSWPGWARIIDERSRSSHDVDVYACQDALIRRAAEVEGTSITEFTVEAALSYARDVLVDRRLFMLDDAAWSEFPAVLDRPIAYKPRLEKLFASESIFE